MSNCEATIQLNKKVTTFIDFCALGNEIGILYILSLIANVQKVEDLCVMDIDGFLGIFISIGIMTLKLIKLTCSRSVCEAHTFF